MQQSASPLDPDTASPSPTVSRRRWQFSLRFAFLCLLGLSILLAIGSRFPRQSAFAASMLLLFLAPLAVAECLLRPLYLLRTWDENRYRPGAWRWTPIRSLRAGIGATPPAPVESIATCVISIITITGLWPLLREIGLCLSLLTLQPMARFTWREAWRNLTDSFTSWDYWVRLWKWELWSVSRWWLLFGIIAAAWLVFSRPARRRFSLEPASATVARFLAFGSWLVALEVAFLIGVWIESPNTVPEPSTGFVVGIFSWPLWHWDCWLNRGWLIRGALPSFVVAAIFLRGVLRWRLLPALAAAILLIPIALWLSIACTVAWQHGLPELF